MSIIWELQKCNKNNTRLRLLQNFKTETLHWDPVFQIERQVSYQFHILISFYLTRILLFFWRSQRCLQRHPVADPKLLFGGKIQDFEVVELFFVFTLTLENEVFLEGGRISITINATSNFCSYQCNKRVRRRVSILLEVFIMLDGSNAWLSNRTTKH